jgi:hypothetical protein
MGITMRQPLLSDDDLSKRAKRRFRESLVVALVFGFAMIGLTFSYKIADQQGVFQRLGFSHEGTEQAFWEVTFVLLTVFVVFTVVRYWTPKAERDPQFLRKDMDNIHTRWRWLTLILSAMAVLNAINFIGETHRGGSVAPWVTGIMFVLLAVLVCFGPGCISKSYRQTLNDELMRTHRARAARFGYLLLMPGLLGLVAVLQWRPQAGLAAAMNLLCAGGVLPSLYFVILDWISTRGETP